MTREAQLVETEVEHATVNTADNSTTVFSGPCIYYGAVVTTVLSAHTVIITDGSGNTIDQFAASAAVGTKLTYPFGVRCATSLVVNPDDSSTGNITVFFRRLVNAT
jgi:hypothetical protein